jgi:hypothetical protein
MINGEDSEETKMSISHLHRKREGSTSTQMSDAASKSSHYAASDEDSIWRRMKRMKSAGEEVSSIYSLHIPKNIEFMLWTMSLLLFFAIFTAFIYFMDRVSPWILIPMLSIPIIFWLVFTFAAYWTETRVYYLIKRTLNYDIIQTLRGYRQYVIRRKER